MDFTSMNFGDLLFALNCDRLKNDIRKIEKINKRIVQSKNGVYFNDIYIYIYMYIFGLHHYITSPLYCNYITKTTTSQPCFCTSQP